MIGSATAQPPTSARTMVMIRIPHFRSVRLDLLRRSRPLRVRLALRARIRILHLSLVTAIAALASPATALAQPGAASDSLTAQDRELLTTAEQLATEASQLL